MLILKKGLSSLLLLLSFVLFSCTSDSDDKIPRVERAELTVDAGYSTDVWLSEGNNSYSISIENPDLAAVRYEPYSATEGRLIVEGKKGGKTVVTVKDNITGDRLIINLEVLIYEFILKESETNVVTSLEKDIYILSGNGKYEIRAKDKSLLRTALHQTSVQEDGKSYYLVNLYGLKPGSTEVEVKDIVLNETKTIKVDVTYAYLSLAVDKVDVVVEATNSSTSTAIKADIAKTGLLQKNYVYSMVRNNDSRLPLYIFETQDNWKKGIYASMGSYSFMIGYNIGLYYRVGNEQHALTMRAPVSTYKTIYDLFDIYYMHNAVEDVEDNKIELTEDLTDKYKEKYQGVTSVKVKAALRLYTPDDSPLPLSMVQ